MYRVVLTSRDVRREKGDQNPQLVTFLVASTGCKINCLVLLQRNHLNRSLDCLCSASEATGRPPPHPFEGPLKPPFMGGLKGYISRGA